MRVMGWLLLAATVLGLATPVEAGGWKDFCRKFRRDYERTRAWPEPFIHKDREAARAPWEVMTHNGWRAQNTLSEELFTEEGDLTEAGRRKVMWIATQAPEERRTVYVLATEDLPATQTRTAAVRSLVAQLAQAGIAEPQLMMTSRRPLRWSGDYYEQVEQKGRDAIGPPVLPEMVLTTDG